MTGELALWQELFGEYLGQRGASPRTVAAYTAELKPFFRYVESCGVESVAGLSRAHLEGYQRALFYRKHRRRTLDPATQRTRLQALKRFTRFLARRGFLLWDPGASLELPAVPARPRRDALAESEVLRLLEAPNPSRPLGLRDRAVLETLYGTALRNSELAQLRLEHLDFSRHVLAVTRGKGGRQRLVPLGEAAESALSAYLQRERPVLARSAEETRVFLTRLGQEFRRSELAELVARWARRADLTRRVTPHMLRRSCATHMLRRGARLGHVQRLLGHASPSTTDRYTPLELSDLREMLLRCHPRARRRRTDS